MASRDEHRPERFVLVKVRENCGAALPLTAVTEVTRPLPVEAVAGAPAFVRGLTIVRGTAMPVIDLAALLGLEDAGKAERFVIVRVDTRFVAVAVNAVVDVTDLERDSLQEAPPLLRDVHGDRLEALAALDRDLLLVLRMSRLLPSDFWPIIDTATTGAP